MKIELKSKDDLSKMRLGGKIASRILNKLCRQIRPGVATASLDERARKLVADAGARPSFLGYHGYPAALCISVNSEVVHGIPGSRVLDEGDIVGLDMGVYYQGFHTDTAKTMAVGKISPEARKLMQVTKKALERGIAAARAGAHLGDVQNAIQTEIETAGFGIVRDLAGHGVGRELQEPPSIPNFGKPGTGPILREGMTLALEPMVCEGNGAIKILSDGWTVVTAEGSLSAHFEHTIAITKSGAEVLTLLNDRQVQP